MTWAGAGLTAPLGRLQAAAPRAKWWRGQQTAGWAFLGRVLAAFLPVGTFLSATILPPSETRWLGHLQPRSASLPTSWALRF